MRSAVGLFLVLVPSAFAAVAAGAQTARIVGPQQSPVEVRAHVQARMDDCRLAGGTARIAPTRQAPLVTALDWTGDGQADFMVDDHAVLCDGAPPPYCRDGCSRTLFASQAGGYVAVGSAAGRGGMVVQGGRPLFRAQDAGGSRMYGWNGRAFTRLDAPEDAAPVPLETSLVGVASDEADAVTGAIPMADLILAAAPAPGAIAVDRADLSGHIRATGRLSDPWSVGRAAVSLTDGPVEFLHFTNPALDGTTPQGGTRMDPRPLDLPGALTQRSATVEHLACMRSEGSPDDQTTNAYAVRASGKAPFWISVTDWRPRGPHENYVFSADVLYEEPPSLDVLLDDSESEVPILRC